MNAADVQTWPERNQRWLTRRFTAWRVRLEDGPSSSQGVEEEPDGDFEPAAQRLATLFGLSIFETELLVLAAGVEIDAPLRQAVTPRLTLALALSLLSQPHWDALSPNGPLRHWSLLQLDSAGAGFGQAGLRIDERLLHFLTGVAAFDERLTGIARPLSAPPESTSLAARVAAAMAGLPRPLVLLPDALLDAGRRTAALELAAASFAEAGLQALWIDAGALPSGQGVVEARELVDTARRIDREAALSQAGLVLVFDPEAHAVAATLRLIAALRSPLVVLGAPTPLQLAEAAHDRRLLRFRLPPVKAALREDLPTAVQQAQLQFHVEPAVLEQVLIQSGEDDVWNGLREAARGGLDALAQRLDSQADFDDLVLPPLVMAQLREIAGQLGQRRRVYEDWGFGEKQNRGLGIAALFAGESGTGKTLAAEAIANEARLDLYRIDLASVVSKYIGETEKNLARLFDAAERSGAVLLFDEADALFGKRSEVKDSHDRYANIEVAYLLQRIESYRGLAILTSNLKSALDRAFLRRIRFIVQFPFPDEAARQAVWRRQFPPRAPLAGDVDYLALARLPLSGGHIRSVALNAAFQAAAAGAPIGQGVLMAAARAEFAKLERQLPGGV